MASSVVANPSAVAKKLDPAAEAAPLKIRITLTSLSVTAVEKVCASFKNGALDKGLKVKGPVRMPTKKLMLTVRRSPCGNGSNTFDRYELRIHKRILDLVSSPEIVRSITSIAIEPGVDIEVTFSS